MASRHLSERQAFGHWLAGFTAGEGCFSLHYYDQPRSLFCIKLRSDDRPILDEIRTRWGGIGAIRTTPPRPGVPCHIASYGVGGVNDLKAVVLPHFKEFPLRNRKAVDFCYWWRGVHLHGIAAARPFINRGYLQGMYPKWTPADLSQFLTLQEQLQRLRQYNLRH